MDDLHRVNDELPVEHCDALSLPADPVAKAISDRTPAETTPYTIDEAIADAIEQITGEPLPDPYTGDHEIQYWIWTGNRLVPASPEAAERIRQQEAMEQEELHRLHERQNAYRQQRRQSYRRLAKRLVSPLYHLLERWGAWSHESSSWQERGADK